LPSQIPVQLSDDVTVNVKVEYAWKPDICERYKVFGHVIKSYEEVCKEEKKSKVASTVGVKVMEEVQLKFVFSHSKGDNSNWSEVVGRKRRNRVEVKKK